MTVIPSGMFKSVINLLFKYKLRAYSVGFIGLRVEKLHLHQAYKSEMCTSCKDLHSLYSPFMVDTFLPIYKLRREDGSFPS